MKILFFIYGNLEMPSGGFLYDRKVVGHLRAAGHQVDIVSLPWLGYADALGRRGEEAAVPDRLDTRPYDLVLQDELAHPLLCRTNLRLHKRRLPVVSIVHHLRCSERELSFPQRCIAALCEVLYLAGVDGVITNSAESLRQVRRFSPGKRAIIAPPGCDRLPCSFDQDRLRDKCFQPGPLRVCFTGIIIPRKGLHVLLTALGHMPAGDWRLSIVGSWEFDLPYAEKMREMTRSSALRGGVTVHGNVPDGDLARIFDESHILAVPSSYEGFGIIFAEAMGFGLPVAGCRAGALPEIVRHGYNGFLVRPGDCPGLASHLAEIHRNRGLLLEMGLAARRSFLCLPGWGRSLPRVAAFLEELTGGLSTSGRGPSF